MRRRALDLVSVPTVIAVYVAAIVIIGYVIGRVLLSVAQ